jgi:hypothetical protein
VLVSSKIIQYHYQDASGDQGYLQDASFATTDDDGSGGAAFDNTWTRSSNWCVQRSFLILTLQANQLLQIQLQQAQHLELTTIQAAVTDIGFVNDNPQQEYVRLKAPTAAVTQAMTAMLAITQTALQRC